jgi:hypothetical protein
MWQVEREGSMDWITLLIPIKLAVFCFFLWYGFNYLWGWNSTSSREVHAASAWTDAAGSRGWRSSRNSQTPLFTAVLFWSIQDELSYRRRDLISLRKSYPQEKALITIRIRVIMMIEIGLVQFRRIRLTLFHNKERLRCWIHLIRVRGLAVRWPN